MKTNPSKKTVNIHSDPPENQENVKNTRKSLKVLQQRADKENLVGRSITDTKLGSEKIKRHHEIATQTDDDKTACVNKAVQTGATVTVEDLCGDEPSVDYWRALAEKRGESLNDSLQENERLREHVDALREENRVCKEMLDESKHLVEVLQEMLEESQPEAEREEDV